MTRAREGRAGGGGDPRDLIIELCLQHIWKIAGIVLGVNRRPGGSGQVIDEGTILGPQSAVSRRTET